MSFDVLDTPTRVRSVAVAGQTVFTVPFEFRNADELNVYVNKILLAYDPDIPDADHYAVTGAGVTGGGVITFGAGLDQDDDVLVVRNVPVESPADFALSGPFDINALNRAFEDTVMMLRDMKTKLDRRYLGIATTDLPETMSSLPVLSARQGGVLGFDSFGNPVIKLVGDLSDELGEVVSRLQLFNPMESRFGGVGDGAVDDAVAVQSATDALLANGGGILLINQKHLITSGVEVTGAANLPVAILFSGPGELVCKFLSADVGIHVSFPCGQWVVPGIRIKEPRIKLHASALTLASMAIHLDYTAADGGGTNGPVIEGGCIESANPAYWLRGIKTDNCSKTKIDRVSLHNIAGLSSDKSGSPAGIQLGNFAQGTRITRCDIRGFYRGVYDTDTGSLDPSQYQAEGVTMQNNNVQACERGVDFDLTDTEVSWSIIGNQFSTQTAIRARNLNGLTVVGNSFQKSNQGKDAPDIQIIRDDGVSTLNTNGANTMIANNRTFGRGDINFDVASYVSGAATVLTYVNTSAVRTITGITVDASGYVTVSFSGAVANLQNTGLITISGVLQPTQANGDWKIGDLGTSSFRLYNQAGSITSPDNLVNGTGWPAYTSGGTFIRIYSSGTIADGDVLYIDNAKEVAGLDNRAVIVANHNAGAKTFTAKDYYTGADINSAGWAALANRADLTRHNPFVEVKGGGHVVVANNLILERSVTAHLWANAKNITLSGNQAPTSAAYRPNKVINDSSYSSSILVQRKNDGDVGDSELAQNVMVYSRTNGSPGDGVNDDAPYWNDALAAGRTIILSDRKSYLLKQPVTISVDGTGIIAPNKAAVKMLVTAGAFDNDAYADRYSVSNSGHKYSVGVYALNRAGVFVKGLKMQPSAWTEYRYLSAIYMKTCSDIEIEGNEISNFARGLYIAGNDLTRPRIRTNHIHDCYSKLATLDDGTTPIDGSTGQMTAIALDYDGTTGSSEFDISGNIIRNITQSAAIIAVIGHQVDAINLQGNLTKASRLGRIFNNRIYNVGEGVDCFGNDNLIFGNTFERCFTSPVKLIHGASRNHVFGNTMIECGLCGMRLGGSNSSASNADGNVFHDNEVYKVNSAIDWLESDGTKFYTTSAGSTYWTNTYNGGAGTPTAGIRIDVLNGGLSQAANDQFNGNKIDCNSTGDYGIYVENTVGGSPHTARNNTILNPKTADVLDTKGYIEFSNGKTSHLEAAATYTLTNTTAAQNIFDSAGKYRFNAKAGRRYKVRAMVQVTGLSGSANSLSFLFGGTASFTRVAMTTIGKKGGGAGTGTMCNFTSAAAQQVTGSDTQTSGQFEILEGTITVLAAGTIIPQLQMNTNAAAAVVAAGSMFEFTEDLNTIVGTGDWST